jgi:tetratricopeptide (TPR) repeat protein
LPTKNRLLYGALLIPAVLGPVFFLAGILSRGLAIYYAENGRLVVTCLLLSLSATAAAYVAVRPGNATARIVAGAALLINLGSLAYSARLWSIDMERAFAEVEMAPIQVGRVGILISPVDHSPEAVHEARAIERRLNSIIDQLDLSDYFIVRHAYPVYSSEQAERLAHRMRAHIIIWKTERPQRWDSQVIDMTYHVTVLGANETELDLQPLRLMLLMGTSDTFTLHTTRLQEEDTLSPLALQVVAPVASAFGCLSLDRPMQAAALYDGVLQIEGLSAEQRAAVHAYYGTALLYLERPDLAMEQFELSNELQPNAMAWTGIGNASLAGRDHPSAREAYTRAIAVDPYNPMPYCGLGILLLRESRVSQALTMYRQAIALQPSSSVPYALVGMAQELSGDIDAAREAYHMSASFAGPMAGLYTASVERADEILRNPPTPVPTATPRPRPTPTPVATVAIYRVERGDTLAKIAQDMGVTIQALIDANELDPDGFLQVGQTLLIPKMN